MCEITPPATLTLPADARAPGIAREFLRHAVCEPHGASVLDDAQLLVSELVTNAVRHGAPPITAELSCVESTSIVVRVTDASPAEPVLGAASATSESGRGVALVDIVSDAWGVESEDGNEKTVWFRLRT